MNGKVNTPEIKILVLLFEQVLLSLDVNVIDLVFVVELLEFFAYFNMLVHLIKE